MAHAVEKNCALTMSLPPAPAPQTRLQFIDAARALAILLMLEGHFVSLTLAPEWQRVGQPLYEGWLYARGLAAPMFFTVTGLVFTYLLSGSQDTGFFAVRRVRRGLIRAGELLLWGYLLQIDFNHLGEVLEGRSDGWLGAFHVLQCIGVGLFGLIVTFGLMRRWGLTSLMVGYLALALGIFMMAVILANHEGYVPAGAAAWLQNPIKGPLVNFPIAPWLSYTFYGGVIGVLLRKQQGVIHPWMMMGAGLLVRVTGLWIDQGLAMIALIFTGATKTTFLIPAGFHMRVGEVILLLGVVIWLEMRFHPLPPWFLTVGRNTFAIYVAHAILLYGAIFGWGLQIWLREALNPWQAALGSVAFCGAFALAAQGVEPLAKRWRSWRG